MGYILIEYNLSIYNFYIPIQYILNYLLMYVLINNIQQRQSSMAYNVAKNGESGWSLGAVMLLKKKNYKNSFKINFLYTFQKLLFFFFNFVSKI